MASRQGLEPRPTVLETDMLPLHQRDTLNTGMNITFKPVTDILYQLHCTDSQDWQHLRTLVEHESWTTVTVAPNSDFGLVVDSVPAHTVSNTELKSWCSSFASGSFKNLLLDQLFANPTFHMAWGQPERRYFDNITSMEVNLVRTPANFINHPWHIDNRSQVAFGMIYLIDGDDFCQSTYFDTVPNQDRQRIPTGMGQGWFVVNHERARHRGNNATDHPRYCLKFSLDLNVRESHAHQLV